MARCATIGDITCVKWRLHFEKPAPNQTTTISSLRSSDHVDEREEGHEDQRRKVLLRARGDEQHLSLRPRVTSRCDHGDDRRRRDETMRCEASAQ